MRPLPEPFVARVLDDLGEEEGRALCQALNAPAPVSVRLHPAKAGGEPLAILWASGGDGKSDESPVKKAGNLPAEQAGGEAVYSEEPGMVGGEGFAGCVPAARNAKAEGLDGGARGAACNAEGLEVEIRSVAQESVLWETWQMPEDEGGESASVENGASDGSGKERLDAMEGGLQVAKPILLPKDWRIPWSESGYYLPERPPFTFDPDFHAGAYYVQEAGSQFVGHLFSRAELAGCRILDMCAAPGGKTTIYASLVGPHGLVVANEIDRRRAQALTDNVRKWGTGNVAVTVAESQQLGAFEGWFDAVAVDAPCSGEGMFRKDEGARAEWSEGNVRLCAVRQAAILREAWRALRPGGLLLYSTCTFNRMENEGVLETFAAEMGAELAEAEPVAVDPVWGIVCGRVGAFRTFRFYPHRAQGEGFFAAVARKVPAAGSRVRTPKPRRSMLASLSRAEAAELARWVQRPEAMRFFRAGDTCYTCSETQAAAVQTLADTLPVIYSGVEMGPIFKGKLRPAHALALATQLDRRGLSVVEVTTDEALAYLRRQELVTGRFSEGMNLVVCRGRALGWAKRIGNRVNNLYPQALRIVKN